VAVVGRLFIPDCAVVHFIVGHYRLSQHAGNLEVQVKTNHKIFDTPANILEATTMYMYNVMYALLDTTR
jgi:hypothetical protein